METVTPDYFKRLDEHCKGGWKAGELTLFYASPSYGYSTKSWLWMSAIKQHIENGGTVTFTTFD